MPLCCTIFDCTFCVLHDGIYQTIDPCCTVIGKFEQNLQICTQNCAANFKYVAAERPHLQSYILEICYAILHRN